MIFLAIFAGLIFIFFALVVLQGAPYVPTHKKALQLLFDENLLKKDDLVVDLGSGDGVFLKMLAQKGYRAVGYEINPFLCLVSYIRCWKYRGRVKIYWRNFWLAPLPQDTKVVYVFLASAFMKRFKNKIEQQAKTLTVVSNGFELPDTKIYKKVGSLIIYKFN